MAPLGCQLSPSPLAPRPEVCTFPTRDLVRPSGLDCTPQMQGQAKEYAGVKHQQGFRAGARGKTKSLVHGMWDGLCGHAWRSSEACSIRSWHAHVHAGMSGWACMHGDCSRCAQRSICCVHAWMSMRACMKVQLGTHDGQSGCAHALCVHAWQSMSAYMVVDARVHGGLLEHAWIVMRAHIVFHAGMHGMLCRGAGHFN
eukprot:350724-Chlamydomonas_euryale.AAC.9